MTISRGQMNRQLYMGGGIMNVVPRDRAFLGGIKKAVKKAVGSVKKIASSDLGKAALVGAAAFGIPGTSMGGIFGRASFGGAAPGMFGIGGIGNLYNAAAVNKSLLGSSDYQGGPTSMFEGAKKFFGSKAGKFATLAGVTGFLTSTLGMTEEQAEEELSRDPSTYLKLYYTNLNPNASEEEVTEFVTANTSEYAVGGRVGFATAGSTSSPEYQTGIGSLFEEDFTPDQAAIDEAYDVQEEEGMPIYGEGQEGATDPDTRAEPEYYDYFKDISSKPDFVMPEGSSERDDLNEAFLFRDNDMAKAEKIIDEQGLDELYEKAVEIVKDNDEANEYFLSLVNNKDLNISAADAYYSVIKKFGTNKAEGGRIGFSSGTYSDFEEFMKKRGKAIEEFNRDQILEEFQEYMKSQDPTVEAAEGGRIGYSMGGDIEKLERALGEDDIQGLAPFFNLPALELNRLLNKLREKKIKQLKQKELDSIYEMGSIGAADGGRIGFSTGNPLPPDPTTPVNPFKPKPIGPVLPNKEMASYGFDDAMADSYDMYLEMKEKGLLPKDMTFNEFLQEMSRKNKGLEKGIKMASAVGDESDDIATQLFGKPVKDLNPSEMQELQDEIDRLQNKFRAADGGIMNRARYALGDSASQNAMQAASIEGLPIRQNQSGVSELDLRDNGGFIPPVGIKEKEDDIPAMLSNNEFVFTADAVRGMGDGDVELGAQRMYDQMKRLEAGGKV